jgi:SAM-dependent methyltransferase
LAGKLRAAPVLDGKTIGTSWSTPSRVDHGMHEAEFDKFADEYRALHASNIRMSGESPEFFAEYKVRDVIETLSAAGPLPPRPTILDFGGGIGTSVPHFRKHCPEARLTCLDVSRRSLALASERFPGMADFTWFDGKTVPFPDGSFDVAFAACVFHHIDHALHGGLLRELRRVLAPGGMIFIFEHNPLNPLTRHAVNTCAFDEDAHLLSGSSMRRSLVEAGFADAEIRYRLFFPRWLDRFRPLEKYLTWMPLGAQYYGVGRKHP